MNIIRKTLLPLFPVLLISMLLTGCSPSASTQTPAALPVTAVPERTLSEARIVPIRNAALSFPSAGIVDEVIAPEGASVKEGDVIARLKGTDRARAAITQAEVQILSAKKDLDDFIEKSGCYANVVGWTPARSLPSLAFE